MQEKEKQKHYYIKRDASNKISTISQADYSEYP